MAMVKVKLNKKSGNKISPYTKNSGASSVSKKVGDCSPKGVAKKSVEVYKKANVKNPIKTGNLAVDYTVGKIPLVKDWNLGFNIGKASAMAKAIYDETCKKRK